MRKRGIRILVLEDDPDELNALIELVAEVDQPSIQLQYTDCFEAGLEWLEQRRTDIILLKFPLEGTRGMEALRKLQRSFPNLPIVVMTHLDDEIHALESLKRGAQDFLIQGQWDSRQIVRTLRTAIIRKQAQQRSLRVPGNAVTLAGGRVALRPPMVICAWCQHVRVKADSWIPLQRHMREFRETPLNHGFMAGICPICRRVLDENEKAES